VKKPVRLSLPNRFVQ